MVDGRASGANDKTVRVWDAATGTEIVCLSGLEDTVRSLAFSPDGRRLATGTDFDTVHVWDLPTRAEALYHLIATTRVASIAWLSTPDARFSVLPAGAYDKVQIWDTATGDRLLALQGEGDVAAIAAGSSRFPWTALRQKMETTIQQATSQQSLAWFPESIYHLCTHSSARIWAGSAGSYLCLFKLEGDVPPKN